MWLVGLGLSASGYAQVTFKAVEGSQWNEHEGSDKVCDGDLNTKWCKYGSDTEQECYVVLEASEATYIQGFVMTTANDNEKWQGRTPKTYTLSGCDTQEGTYEQIYYQADDNYIEDKNFTPYTVYCNSKKKYKYFKLHIKDSNINGDRLFQISEFTLIPATMGITYKEGDGKAYDGNTDAKWEGNCPTSVTLEASEPLYLTGYQFTTANDNKDWRGRNPKNWKIEGSNDNADWHEIISVADNQVMQDFNYYPYYFTLDNPLDEAYKYYRITVTGTQGGGYFQLGEVALVGTVTPHVWETGKDIAPTCTVEGHKTFVCKDCGAVRDNGTIPALGHEYTEKGLCVRCAFPQAGWMTAVDGWYEPTSVEHFNWLASTVRYVDAAVNIRLNQDVDLTDFAGFGNGENAVPYKGELDGRGHWLKNFSISVAEKNCGLFGNTEGAHIHDLGLTGCSVRTSRENSGVLVGNMRDTRVNRVAVMNSFAESRDHVAAIAGNTDGTTLIANCLSNADVHSTEHQAGGLVGTTSGSMTLEKCLFTGTVKNDWSNATGLVSLIDNGTAKPVIRYNIIAATQLSTAGGNENIYPIVNQVLVENGTFDYNYVAKSMVMKTGSGERENAFNTNDYNGFTTSDEDMQVKSFYGGNINWDMENDWKFIATGKYPVLAWMPAESAQEATVGQAGYATLTAAEPLDFSASDVKAYAAQLAGGYVHLAPVVHVPAGEAVVLEAKAGTYSIPFAVEKLDAMPQNDLKASDGNVQGGSSIFVLGDKQNGVGFYPTAATLTLPQGKGYLVVSDEAGVKPFIGIGNNTGTGIAIAPTEDGREAVIYNLAGQRVGHLQKGVNIVNGKKIIY